MEFDKIYEKLESQKEKIYQMEQKINEDQQVFIYFNYIYFFFK